jgi:hypothetical protein
MDRTNLRNDEENKSHLNEELEEPKPRDKATLGELYQYLDGSWYLFVVVGLLSAFICGVGAAFVVLVIMNIITDITDDRRFGTLARKS